MSMKQISVFVENKPGTMCSMTAALAEHGIDLRALYLAEVKDFGIVRLIVDDVYNAATVLRDAGYVHKITPVLGVAIPDTPGGLNTVLNILAENSVNVEYMYSFLGEKDNHAYMIFRVEDTAAASAVLVAKGIKILKQEDFA